MSNAVAQCAITDGTVYKSTNGPLFRNTQPSPICNIEDLTRVTIQREDDVTHCVSAYIAADKFVTFAMDDRDAVEFALVLAGYYRLLVAGEYFEQRHC